MDGASAFDLVLRGGVLVEPSGLLNVDLAIREGRVAAHLGRDEPARSGHEIDVRGRYLLPGLVDAHAHLREPGLTHKEDVETGTKAAAAGGVTSVLVMPTDEPWTDTPDRLRAKMALTEGRIRADLGFQVAMMRSGTDCRALSEAGAVSFEIFTADVPADYRHDTLDALVSSLQAVAAIGGLAAVSPGDQSLLGPDVRLGHPESGIAWYCASRPPLAEAAGIARALLAAADQGARLHIRQSNSALGLETWRRMRAMADATIETTVQCLLFTADDYRRLGASIKASPPFRMEADRLALLAAVRDGTVDMVASDHAPHTPADKQAPSPRFADIPGGLPGLQTLLPTMLHLVDRGDLALPDLVRVCARNPADRFGFAGRKGSLMPGCDADIVVLDPARTSQVTDEAQYSKAAVTPFAGLSIPFRLDRVWLRGQVIYEDGAVSPEPRGRVAKPLGAGQTGALWP